MLLLCDLLVFEIEDLDAGLGASCIVVDEADEGAITFCALDVDDSSDDVEADIEDSNIDELDNDDDALWDVCPDCGEHAVSSAPITRQEIPTRQEEAHRP